MTRGFWQNRSVLVTGHTGFKGGWLVTWLRRLGARVTGYALEPSTSPSLFVAANLHDGIQSIIGDVRDAGSVAAALHSGAPEVLFHLAAQPLVRVSYAAPVETFSTNVMGTVNVLEAARSIPSIRAIVVVTTDKCYEDQHWPRPYRETDPLGGFDPYASSKACTELATRCYRDSFLAGRGVGVATARGGNVIGGGDWSQDRLLPDLVEGCRKGTPVRLRRPEAVRPWQHVLDLAGGYLTLAERLAEAPDQFSGAWNFGPDERSDITVGDLARRVVELWGSGRLELDESSQPHESAALRLDSSKARAELGWRPRLSFDEAVAWTVEWYRGFAAGDGARPLVDSQIERYEGRSE
jgi:CDP-glucose 4,6-dehydratase